MNKKILIVRGDRQKAKALSFLLAGSGYQICTHATAGEAVEAARHQRFDLAITDGVLPENQPDLGLVSTLKEAQPSLPVLYLSDEENLETVISCIRAGVNEVVHNPNDLQKVIETTHSFFRAPTTEEPENEVTWQDILEVERMLESTIGGGRARGGSIESSAEVAQMRLKLDEALKERDRISGELSFAISNLEKSKRMIEELKNENGHHSTDSEIAERAAELDEREKRIKDLSSKIAQQKVDLETQIAELEAQKIELEEAQKEVKDNLDANPAALYQLNQEFEVERTKMNEKRLEQAARIKDLERELEAAQAGDSAVAELEARVRELNDRLQDAQEQISQKDFLIQQRERELEEAREPQNLSQPEREALEEERRLLEIEKHKLSEKIDQFEIEKRMAQETHTKNQRELQVERRDAEVSLRELQNQIKEEQLKLKVDQASLKDEIRQFEQARQNFQEDVQDLQSKQAELRKMEAYLQQMEKTIQNGNMENALPKPDSSALDPIEVNSAAHNPKPSAPPPSNGIEQGAPSPSAPASTPQGAEGKGPDGQPKDPSSWGKPDFEKKKAGRGPLRIGRRSSF
ncbi:response regulator [Pelagicoccus sp. SDUM812003]|uniref:response regulator n=1 Tax=Pelagicoccus sp. SDUM812003 TaxID=3041267 RepID=UPI00280E3A25|nr:response regulator [Pelagicoccus sp. SDUM812003]MDQ8204597.1 response regulator [Pelagicoccus sp. SDUM812003]